MNRQNIQQIIRELFRQYYNANAGESFPLEEVWPNPVGSVESGKFGSDGHYFIMSKEGTNHAQDVAKSYWTERNEDEIERDEKAGVTEIDYIEWVMAELSDLIPAAPTSNKFQTWAAEINKDWNGDYKANATENSLIVNFNSEEVARIDYNSGRYTVTGTDKESVEQLEYMVNR